MVEVGRDAFRYGHCLPLVFEGEPLELAFGRGLRSILAGAGRVHEPPPAVLTSPNLEPGRYRVR